MLWKIIKRETNRYMKTVFLAKRKLNNIQKNIFKSVADADVTHNKFTLVRNELENYRRPSDMIKMKDSQ